MPSMQVVKTLSALIKAVPELIDDALPLDTVRGIIERGSFTPEQDDQLGFWFSRYLTLRHELWDVIDEVDEEVQVMLKDIDSHKEWQCFVIGFSAACLLVRLDRFLVFEYATHTVIQRKFNEAFPEYRIARKQYSKIFSAYTDPATMLRLYDAIKLLNKNKAKLRALQSDELVGPLVEQLPVLRSYLNTSKRNYLVRLFLFLRHKWRRRGASARYKTMFAVFEAGGRVAAKLNPGKHKKVTAEILEQVSAQLLPGDVLVSRHQYALTNYFLPGTWPHASLYIGTPSQREAMEVNVSPPIAHRWRNGKSTLEALRDGVLFRQLHDTLRVDAFVVLRPNLSLQGLREGIERIVKHEGKEYKFDFDFFASDRLVCTEVVYRAFDGLENMHLELTERAGRKTLTAEDLLDCALDTDMFSVYSIFGYPDDITQVLYGDEAHQALIRSYRTSSD